MRFTRRDLSEGVGFGGTGSTHRNTFAATPGHVVSAEDGRAGCDHNHRGESDPDLLARYGKRFGFVHVGVEAMERTPQAAFRALQRALAR